MYDCAQLCALSWIFKNVRKFCNLQRDALFTAVDANIPAAQCDGGYCATRRAKKQLLKFLSIFKKLRVINVRNRAKVHADIHFSQYFAKLHTSTLFCESWMPRFISENTDVRIVF